MPGYTIPEWVTNPCGLVDGTFGSAIQQYRNDPQKFRTTVETNFLNKLEDGAGDCRHYVPWVNSASLDQLQTLGSGTLVRYRGMIQDERPVGYHQPFLDVRHSITGIERTVCAMFKNHVEVQENEKIVSMGNPQGLCQMRILKCVAVPGETKWVRREHVKPFDDRDLSVDNTVTIIADFFAGAGEDISINDEVCLYGILQLPEKRTEMDNSTSQGQHAVSQPEIRFSVICYKILPHGHPFLSWNKSIMDVMLTDLCHVRPFLIQFLRNYLCGDEIAAEYLLFHLLSSTRDGWDKFRTFLRYSRREGLPIGNMSLNLTNIPGGSDFVEPLICSLKKVVTKLITIPITITKLNGSRMSSKLNTEADAAADHELLPGLLQVTKHTHLILDEGGMTAGTLNDSGVKNVMALQKLAKHQKMDIDYFTQNVEFLMDVPVLILSQGSSLVECRYTVPIVPDATHVETSLSDKILDEIRRFLIVAKFAQYEINDEMRREIVEQFVERRKADRSTNGDILHNQLELARYGCISYGERSLTQDRWKHVLELEAERTWRLNRPK